MKRCPLAILLIALGCSAQYEAAKEARSDFAEVGMAEAEVADATASMEPSAAEGEAEALPEEGKVQRKIIYTANVDLVVEEFDGVPEKIEELAAQFDGRVARSSVSGSPGSPRSGQWTVRVPVARFDAFLAAAQKIGEVRSVSKDSKDVTEEYVDVEARIRNRKRTEERLVRLLEDATGKLDDVLKVERELNRVREEIERVEGRLRVLEDLTSMTTVDIRVTEIKGYEPPEAPTYLTRVRRAWELSIDNLVWAAEGLSIAAVYLAPWLCVLAVPLALLILLVRWLVRRKRRRVPTAEVVQR
jgi:hypothetical protein